MKDYDKNAAKRRMRAEIVLEFQKIQEQMFDRAYAYIEGAMTKAITDGSLINADQIGKDAAHYGAQPWGGLGARPAIEHKPARKPRKR